MANPTSKTTRLITQGGCHTCEGKGKKRTSRAGGICPVHEIKCTEHEKYCYIKENGCYKCKLKDEERKK